MEELQIEEDVTYLTKLFSLLGDKNRLLILQSLMEGERNVGELQTLLQTSQANVSKHLRKLREGKLVVREKRGTQTFHTLASPLVITELCNLAINAKTDEPEEQETLAGRPVVSEPASAALGPSQEPQPD